MDLSETMQKNFEYFYQNTALKDMQRGLSREQSIQAAQTANALYAKFTGDEEGAEGLLEIALRVVNDVYDKVDRIKA